MKCLTCSEEVTVSGKIAMCINCGYFRVEDGKLILDESEDEFFKKVDVQIKEV